MTYDHRWPHEQRVRAALAMLSAIQLDIPAGRYCEDGRSNCQSVMYVLTLDAPLLDAAMVAAPEDVRRAVGYLLPVPCADPDAN